MPGILPYHRVFQLSLEILRKIKVESEQMYNEEMDSQWTLRHFRKKSGPSNRVSQGIINLRCLVMCSLLGKHVSWCIYRQLEYCMFLSSVKKKKPTFMWWVHSRLSLSLYLRVHTFHAQHKLWLLRNINSYTWVREFFFFFFLVTVVLVCIFSIGLWMFSYVNFHSTHLQKSHNHQGLL